MTNINMHRGRTGRELRLAAKQQWRRVRCNLTKRAQIAAGVIFE